MKPEIFVSYSREDQAQVFPIVEKLRERGLNIWIDQEGIHGAKLWSQEIVNAIESSKVFILFASTKAFVSKNVTKELALASESDKHILPVFIENADIPAAMKYQLAGIQHLVHEQGQTDETVGNILSTLGNLDIHSSESQPAVSAPSPTVTKQVSKKPLGVAALIIFLSIIAFLIIRGDYTQEVLTSTAPKVEKSILGICVVTIKDTKEEIDFPINNQSLRDDLVSKLSLFRDYEIIQGNAITADSNAEEYINIARSHNSDFILQTSYNNKSDSINAKVIDGYSGRVFWTKKIMKESNETDMVFLDNATNKISANIAGYDGCIHREVLQRALSKNYNDLKAFELLQLGKSIWEDVNEENLIRAVETLNKCITLNPENATAHAVLADVYYAFVRNNFPLTDASMKSAENIKKAIKLDPKNSVVITIKFWIDADKGDAISSEVLAEEAIRSNPNEPWAIATYGWHLIYNDINQIKGKEYAEKALKYCEHPQGWYYWALAEYHRLNGDYKESLKFMLKTSSQARDYYYIHVASCNWLIGNESIAIDTYENLLKKNPKFNIENYRSNRFVFEGKIIQEFENAFDSLIEQYNKASQNPPSQTRRQDG